ncbi:MAG: hypothetical protein IT381_30100 [Deltaproteobacteria bacterium]|nr:hypothetical protein [Deltaproteobacteria bacterium]
MRTSKALCIAIFTLAACEANAPQPNMEVEAFIPGDAGDPVIQFALATAANTAVRITIRNTSNSNWTQGLLTFSPVFTVGQVASTAVRNYTFASSPSVGNATTLANALGLTLGTNAFLVNALNVGQTATITIPSAANAQISFIAHVATSIDDFVGFRNQNVGAGSITVQGFDPDDGAGGTIVLGNGTTGPAAGSSPVTITNTNPCTVPAMTTAATLLTKNMATAQPNDPAWPGTDGGGDFGGDWTTDGQAASVWVPSVNKPAVTGMFWFIPICPLPGSSASAAAAMDTTLFTQHDSVATLVVYFFDSAGTALKIVEGWPLHRPNTRAEVLAEMAIPEQARRIAIAPMAMISASETASVRYDNLSLSYAPAAATVTAIASDNFSSYDATNQPTGWTESGGDWLVNPSFNHATLWNASWSGGTAAATTTLSKTFPLSATGTLSAQIFAAATYSDASSFVRMDLTFSGGSTVQGEALTGSNYNMLRHSSVAIPAGSTSVTVTINATLGATETSSLYVDDLAITTP